MRVGFFLHAFEHPLVFFGGLMHVHGGLRLEEARAADAVELA